MSDKLQLVVKIRDKLKFILHIQSNVTVALWRRAPNSEDEPRLQLEHPRRIDVCERRDRVCGCADAAHELAERGCRCGGIAVGCDPAAEEIPVIEKIEALQP